MQDDNRTTPPPLPGSNPEDPFIGQTLAGKYRIDGYLKKGGMGTVYRGTHLMLNKQVAIKLIKPELVTSKDIVERFQREAIAASKLEHPNIVTIYDLGQTEDGTLYIAMELVPGKSLKDVVVEDGALDTSRAVHLAKGICAALQVAHSREVIHRDLKPQNIMVTAGSDGKETPKLLDFGIAKTFETDGPALTSTGMVLGTPQYMSPEQAKGTPVDARSDLYALGVILYEMLTGKVPFNDTSVPAVLVKHLNEQPIPPSQIRTDLAGEMETIVLRCLAKDSDDRYQTAEGLSRALDSAVSGLTEAATTPELASAPLPATVKTPAAQTQSPPAPAPAMPAPVGSDSAVPRGTRPTAPVAAPPPTKSRTGLWVGLALAALLILGVGLVGAVILGGMFFGDDDQVNVSEDAGLSDPTGEPAGAAGAMTHDATSTEDSGSPSGPPNASGLESTSGSATISRQGRDSDLGEAARGLEEFGEATREMGEQARGELHAAGESLKSMGQELEQATGELEAMTGLPDVPTILFACEGVRDGCAAVRNALQTELRKRGMSMTRRQDQAQVRVSTFAEEVEVRQGDFGMVLRTYSIDSEADALVFDEPIPMPSPETVSFDTQRGRDKLDERARVYASALAEQIASYWRAK